jgi:hypothetical protein
MKVKLNNKRQNKMNQPNQQELLNKVFELIDSDFAILGKASLMTGIEVKKLMTLRDHNKQLNEKDLNKLKETIAIFDKK